MCSADGNCLDAQDSCEWHLTSAEASTSLQGLVMMHWDGVMALPAPPDAATRLPLTDDAQLAGFFGRPGV